MCKVQEEEIPLFINENSNQPRRLRLCRCIKLHLTHIFLLLFCICSTILFYYHPSTLTLWVFLITWRIYSSCFHEFGHAIFAYFGGDVSVKENGYLYLNPIEYNNFITSIFCPLIFFIITGIPTFGIPSYINWEEIKSFRWRLLTAFGGTFTSLMFLVVNVIPLWFFNLDFCYNDEKSIGSTNNITKDSCLFWQGVITLAYINVSVLFINIWFLFDGNYIMVIISMMCMDQDPTRILEGYGELGMSLCYTISYILFKFLSFNFWFDALAEAIGIPLPLVIRIDGFL